MKQLNRLTLITVALCLCLTTASAALLINVEPPKNTGSKAVIKLELQNTYDQKIKSVRGVVFLLNDQGKVVGQETRWLIGGSSDKPPLASIAKTNFNFVVTADKPFTKTQLIISRIILADGTFGNIQKDVQIQNALQQTNTATNNLK